MSLSHYEEEEETLVAYFKQMLNDVAEEEGLDMSEPAPAEPVKAAPPLKIESAQPAAVPESAAPAPQPEPAVQAEPEPLPSGPAAQAPEPPAAEPAAAVSVPRASAETDPDLAATAAMAAAAGESFDEGAAYGYGRSRLPSMQPQLQESVKPRGDTRPFAEENTSLAAMLEAVETQAETKVTEEVAEETQTEVIEEVETEVVEEVQTEVVEEPVTETAAAVQTAVVPKPVIVQEKTPAVVTELKKEPQDSRLEWENIETPDEFQALFFLSQGVRFAVPLVDLGGIFECDKTTPLFGKPKWYRGMADVRGRKINVVDTLRWVKPDQSEMSEFKYIILLAESLWSISCDKLEGNRYLKKENVKWRQNAGSRPWLAGIVKKEMCALLHVSALIALFNKGVDIKDLK